MEKKGNAKKIIIAVVILVVLVAAIALLYVKFAPKAQEGSKEITVTVVDDAGKETVYETKTDEEFLRPALEAIEELEIIGTEGPYGLYIDSVNGVTANFDEDGAYWAVYVNGAYGNYSIEEQPIIDGDTYSLKYETGM